jgi:hypothetical protein
VVAVTDGGAEDAATLAAEATGGSVEDAATDAAADAAQDAAESAASDSKGIIGALLHTDPDANPQAVAGPPWVGEFVVGIRKVMDAMGIEAGEGDGTPALMNFYRGALHLYAMLQARAQDDDTDENDDVGSQDPEVNINA